jgi:hypothetical protein
MRKFLLSASLSVLGLALTGVSARTSPVPIRSQAGQQSEPAAKQIVGKVTSIGNNGHSFSIASTGDSKQSMEFVVDQNTKVQGEVHVGTTVTVAYQAKEGGENLALSVTAQA